MITFSCPRCGTRYDVDDQLAGKKGRCKACRNVMNIPAPTVSAAVSGMFRLRPEAALTTPPRSAASRREDSPGPTLPSSVALAPISTEVRPIGGQKPAAEVRPHIAAYLHESRSDSLYALAERPIVRLPAAVGGGKPAGFLTRLYRGQIGNVLTILRKLNEFAYLISIPFIAILLIGIVMKSRPIALAGATGVILLNVTRLATGGFAFYMRPFKSSPVEGLLFLFPPYTAYYVVKHWKSMKKTTMRFLEPALSIALVVLAFVFVPWLSRGTTGQEATLRERVRSEASALKSDLRDELEGRGPSLNQAIEGLSDKARRGIGTVKGAMGEQPGPGSASVENPGPNEAPR